MAQSVKVNPTSHLTILIVQFILGIIVYAACLLMMKDEMAIQRISVRNGK